MARDCHVLNIKEGKKEMHCITVNPYIYTSMLWKVYHNNNFLGKIILTLFAATNCCVVRLMIVEPWEELRNEGWCWFDCVWLTYLWNVIIEGSQRIRSVGQFRVVCCVTRDELNPRNKWKFLTAIKFTLKLSQVMGTVDTVGSQSSQTSSQSRSISFATFQFLQLLVLLLY